MSECTRLDAHLLEDLNYYIYDHPKLPRWMAQLRILYPAVVHSRWHKRHYYVLSLLYNLTISLLLSFTYFQLAIHDTIQTRDIGIIGALFTMRVALLTLTVTTTQDVFVYDRSTVLGNVRFEHGFSAWLVFSCRFVASIPFRLIMVLLISLIMYPIIGLRGGVEHFLVFYLTLVLQEIAIVAMGMANGACCKSATLRGTMGALLINFNIIYGGAVYVATTVSWIIRWIQFLSVLYYSSIMISRNEIDPTSPDFDLLTIHDLNLLGIWGAMGGLMGLTAVYFAIGVIGLTLTTRPDRRVRRRLKSYESSDKEERSHGDEISLDVEQFE